MKCIKASAMFSALFLWILVQACGGGGAPLSSATVTWDAPTKRTNNSSLNPAIDLQGYKLYYGSTSHAYTKSTFVTNPSTTIVSHTLILPKGTYFITITAIDQYGQESAQAAEIQKTL